MRILHIVGEVDYSGGEDQLAHLLAHLRGAGHDNHLVLQPGARFADTARDLGLPFDTVRMRSSFAPRAVLAIRRRMRAVAPDLVHFADARAHKLGALASTRRPHPPRVVTRRVNKVLRRGRFTRWLYGRAVEAVVAISKAVREKVLAVGVPPERVHVVHDGVDPARYAGLHARRAAARATLGLPAEALVVVCAARLDPRKGQSHLVRAFRDVAARTPGARLLMAGEGPERAALERTVAALDLGEVVLMPGRLDIRDALAAADAACVPSLNEGFSVFALEAQAAGLPVVASRAGGLLESVAHEESGVLCAPGDEGAWSAALERVLTDEALRHRMGAAGRERVARQFTARHMAEATAGVYGRVAERWSGSEPSR